MYSKLEQMVAEDMLNEGYNPENELDIQDYWSYHIPDNKRGIYRKLNRYMDSDTGKIYYESRTFQKA